MRRVVAATPILLAAAAAIVLAACGLENLPVLDPPAFTEMTPLSTFTVLTNVPTTVAEFRGYELYYKFYARDQAKQTTMTSVDQLVPAGFRRVCSTISPVESQVPPVVLVDPVDRNTEVQTTVYFPDADTAAYAGYGGASPRTVPLRRSVEEAGAPKTFQLSAFDPDDEDIAAIWSDVQSQGNELHLVVYVMSNGLNGWSPTLYSEVSWVGTMIYHL